MSEVVYNFSIYFKLQLKPLINSICQDNLNASEYNECIACIENLQNLEAKNEGLFISSKLSNFNNLKNKDQYKALWNELESWLKLYETSSDRHKILYDFINKIKIKSLSTSAISDITLNDLSIDKTVSENKRSYNQIINRKLLNEYE